MVPKEFQNRAQMHPERDPELMSKLNGVFLRFLDDFLCFFYGYFDTFLMHFQWSPTKTVMNVQNGRPYKIKRFLMGKCIIYKVCMS